MSMLQWYRLDSSHAISLIDSEIQLDMTYSSFSESSLTMIRYRESYLGTRRNYEKGISKSLYW
ncbi:hypothetical protein EPI10_001073 [Gossypium australe]|uniref:Uncharacterized protein n=1 Tax=Gossypium australe TaxID=47621 RepID=A0A5B6V9S2_9ROSI|nr:hypothetical protein EPI10_001073 [Gossypium australe]